MKKSDTKKIFNLVNRMNHTPSQSNSKLDAKIQHKENINALLTSLDGTKKVVGKRD